MTFHSHFIVFSNGQLVFFFGMYYFCRRVNIYKGMKRWKHFDSVGLLVQLMLWGLIVTLPLVMALADGKPWGTAIGAMAGFLPNNLYLMLIFYLNYFWLIPRFLFSRRTLWYFLLNLAFILGVREVTNLIYDRSALLDAQGVPPSLQMAGEIGYAILEMLLILSAIGLKTQKRNSQLELKVAEEERQKVTYELERLKSQLNPHFLFNTLNNISSLVAFDPDQAQISISRLSEMLRYVLYDSTSEHVPLGKERDFMRNYIDLMRLRYTDTLQVEVDMESIQPDTPVAPLLFISLLENAFKHGADSCHPCGIHVSLRQEGGQVRFRVINSLLPKPTDGTCVGGVGLHNLMQRLQLLYPDRHTLHSGEVANPILPADRHGFSDQVYLAELALNLS